MQISVEFARILWVRQEFPKSLVDSERKSGEGDEQANRGEDVKKPFPVVESAGKTKVAFLPSDFVSVDNRSLAGRSKAANYR